MKTYFDPGLLEADEVVDYDGADFETRDALDQRDADLARAWLYDLPARPGTLR
jgi:hypothetical protein